MMPDDIHKQPWLIEIAIESKSKADQEKLAAALAERKRSACVC